MSASNRLPSGQLTPPAMVEERVRRGLPPRSVVSVTGLPLTPAIREAREADVLHRFPMFAAIDATAALPSSLVNSRSTHTGGRLVTNRCSAATGAISINSCTAEIPPPITTTRLPANRSAPG